MFLVKNKTKLVSLLILLLAGGCAGTPENIGQTPSYALTDTEDTAFGKAANKKLAPHPGKSGFVLLTNGLDAFVARALMARRAERSLDVQYYLYHSDLAGRLFLNELIQG